MKKLLPLFILLLAIPAKAQWRVDVESGVAFQSYNDLRIPNKTGTSFSFTDDFELQTPVIPLRLNITYSLTDKDHLFGLFAPLGLNYEGEAPFDINFQDTHFLQGQFIEGFYKFNSYRLGYRRDVITGERWTFGIGFTAKIRDARVQLTSGEVSDKKDDLGFVPLLHLHLAYRVNDFTAMITGDGLAGGPGRAFDFFAGGELSVNDFLAVKAGYRIIEGGADVNTVYNFTLINIATVGAVFTF
jgi:hypothetical protein